MNVNRFIHYKIGHPVHDAKHFQLLLEMDDLLSVLYAHEDHTERLQTIKQHLKEHFDSEHDLMVRINYPYIAAHDRDHEMLVKMLDRLVETYTKGAFIHVTTHQLEELFLQHIDYLDRQYAEFWLKHNGL